MQKMTKSPVGVSNGFSHVWLQRAQECSPSLFLLSVRGTREQELSSEAAVVTVNETLN